MNIQEYKHLLAERTTVQRLLAEIPDEEVLERSGLEARLEDVEDELATVPAEANMPSTGIPF